MFSAWKFFIDLLNLVKEEICEYINYYDRIVLHSELWVKIILVNVEHN